MASSSPSETSPSRDWIKWTPAPSEFWRERRGRAGHCARVCTGLARFLRLELLSLRGNDVVAARHELRHALSYYLLLGLEFLIAADIIETLLKPTLQDLAALRAIVVIRTLINYSLTSELAKNSSLEPKLSAP